MTQDMKIQKTVCPSCKQEYESLRLMAGVKPEPGGFLLCTKCGAVLIFDQALQLALPTREQAELLIRNPRLCQQMAVWQQRIFQQRAARN